MPYADKDKQREYQRKWIANKVKRLQYNVLRDYRGGLFGRTDVDALTSSKTIESKGVK